MEDDEFNFYRVVKGEKNVALPALKDLFETLWNKNYPETPWTYDATSVKNFELKEDQYFKNGVDRLSKKERKSKCDQRMRFQNTFHDKKWKEYEWDVSKFVYALVDSKVFKLDETDVKGKPLSEHIVNIRDIRNEIAHSTTFACKIDHSELTLQALGDHIKAFELTGLNVSSYLEDINNIKLEQKPVSSWEMSELNQELSELKTENKVLKISEELYQEREKRLIAERKMHKTKKKKTVITFNISCCGAAKPTKTKELCRRQTSDPDATHIEHW